MIIKQFQVGDFEVSLSEYPENKNIVGRTVYRLSVQGKGTFVYDVSDEKDEAIQTYEKIILYIVAGHLVDDERNLHDIVEYLN